LFLLDYIDRQHSEKNKKNVAHDIAPARRLDLLAPLRRFASF
jgi:hypothetical protein